MSDPLEEILTDPQVPEGARFCSRCEVKVGRTTGGVLGSPEGHCPECGHRYSFTPKLAPGDVVGNQYEVLGCLAHGGLGWIYLARDHAVVDRHVVLKGVLDAGNAAAMTAAMTERRFLAEIEHPNIVKIHNFVRGVDGTVDGYIVMEYVSGRTLKDVLEHQRRAAGPTACLPPHEAIGYLVEALRPLGHLHRNGLLYCDFKPDNMIQAPGQLKLIDLGAVRRRDDRSPAIYGTVGYQAPEVSSTGPSPASDLYAAGRTLAVLTIPFDYRYEYVDGLPRPEDTPLLAEHESFHRLLLRATAADPSCRFWSAEEMADQLTGVLREILSAQDGKPRPAPSTVFTFERQSFGTDPTPNSAPPDPMTVIDALPLPRVDSRDPAAAFLATIGTDEPAELIDHMAAAPEPTVELCLRLIRAQIHFGDIDDALANVEEVIEWHGTGPASWRAKWYQGLAMLAAGRPKDARDAFDAVISALPGELAPKLALAASAESDGDDTTAQRNYRRVWCTDHSFISAAFGLARTLLATGERAEAIEVLEAVPATSIHSVAARLGAIRSRIAAPEHDATTADDLVRAGIQLEGIDLDDVSRASLTSEVFEAALRWVRRSKPGPLDHQVLGCALVETDLRRAVERCYRTLARHTDDTRERITLVDKANRVRPRTWW